MAQKSEQQAQAPTETAEKDSPLLDLSDQSVKKLIKAGKARGYVTHDELNALEHGVYSALARLQFEV